MVKIDDAVAPCMTRGWEVVNLTPEGAALVRHTRFAWWKLLLWPGFLFTSEKECLVTFEGDKPKYNGVDQLP